jgi:hypothetical protein
MTQFGELSWNNGCIPRPVLSNVSKLLGIVIGEPKSENNVQPIRGRCTKCGYEVNWTLLRS